MNLSKNLHLMLGLFLGLNLAAQEVKVKIIDIPELKTLLVDASQPYHVINFLGYMV